MDDDRYKPVLKDLIKIRREKNAKEGYGFFHNLSMKLAPHIS